MFKTRILTGLLITLALLFAMVGTAAAAPSAQDTTPITGTTESVTPETDETGVTTFLVTLTDDQGGTQTLRISLETALELGLVLTAAENSEKSRT